ncbi:MAG: hypothetical protein JXN61_08555 [Sedimentisphaerales bacterium]|nr:hypothetical protein [Sedimentisphaerales bacterium]
MFDVVLGSVVLAGTSGIRSGNGKTGIADAMSAQSKVLELFGEPSKNNAGQENGQSAAAEKRREAERRRYSRLADLNSKLSKCAEELAKKDKAIMAECELALSKAQGEYERGNARIENLKKEAGLRPDLSVREKDAARRAIAIEEARVETEYEKAKAKAESDREKAKYDLGIWAERFAKASESEEAKIEQEFQDELEQIDMGAQGGQTKTDATPSLHTDDIAPFAKTSIKEPSGFTTSAISGEAKVPESPLPKGESDLFGVRQIRIIDSTVFSEAELLAPKSLPFDFVEEGTENVYDFRALHEVLKAPGQVRQVSKKTIQGLAKYILDRYSKKGYAGIYVYVPQDTVEGKNEFKDGTLIIKVIEGQAAEVAIERYNFDREKTRKGVLKDSVLRSQVKPGELIRKKRLDYSMNLLNLNPDRHINTVVSRSTEKNAVDLTYEVYEANPWHWYAQVDDSGTDKRQWAPRVGLVNTNLTGKDDRFSLMYQAPVDSLDENNAVFGSYEFPLFTPRLRLGFYGGYSQFEITPETAGQGINFRGNGSFYGTTLRYNLFQWPSRDSANEKSPWFLDIIGSLSHERSKVNPSLGLSADVDMDLYGAGAELHRSTKRSGTSFLFNRTTSFDGASMSEFAKARVNTDPDFTIYMLAASHRQFIDRNDIHELSGSLRRISSNERLVPAKMTTFGGLYSVRGYEEDEIVADGGIIASAQYKFDLTKYLNGPEQDNRGQSNGGSTKTSDNRPPNVSLLAFVDHGRAKTKNPVPGEKKAVDLWGAGLGATVEIGEHTCGSFYYSWPLRGTTDTDRGDGRWNFSFCYLWR